MRSHVRDSQNRSYDAAGVRKFAELRDTNYVELYCASMGHDVRTSVRYMPCQVPKLSSPFVIGIDIVEPTTDAFV